MDRPESSARGLLGLTGGDEFHAGNEPQDDLLAAAVPRGASAYIVATAAARSRPEMAVRQGRAWFRQFGLDLEELPVYTRTQARDAAVVASAAEAGFLYLAGGDPGLVASLLRGTPIGSAMIAAWQHGAVLAGSSAGAMALSEHVLVRQAFPGHSERRAVPGLAVVPDAAVLPHHDTFGERWFPSARAALPDATLIGIDERTCALWRDGMWRCLGPGAVTVYAPGTPGARHTTGVVVGLPQPVAAHRGDGAAG